MVGSIEQRAGRRAVILTALAVEYDAVRAHVHDLREELDPRGTIYEIGLFDSPAGAWEIVIAQMGTGNVGAAIAAERAILTFRPTVLLLVGIAGGVEGRVALGDVVVATKVYGYESGKVSQMGEFLPRLDTRLSSSHRLQQRALRVASQREWIKRRIDVPSAEILPHAHVGAIASGEKVLASRRPLEFLGSGVLAADMESYGLLSAIQGSTDVDALVVRGIADVLDQVKGDSRSENSARNAARNASAFAFEVLARLDAKIAPSQTSEARGDLTKQYIAQVSIKGFRSVAEVDWQVSDGPGWHVLIGDNGSGKTTVLRSIALALMNHRETDALRQDWTNWLPQSRDNGRVAITLAGSALQNPVVRSIELSRVTPRPSEAEPVAAGGAGREMPADVFSVGYGPFRRFSGGDLEYEKQIAAWPHLLRHVTLFSEAAALAESLTWLKDLRFKQLERDSGGEFLLDVKAFINESGLLREGNRLADVSSDAVTFMDGNGCAVPIQELCDGFRSVLSLVLDLLRHLATAYGPADVFSRVDPTRVIVPGIMLVDEIDVHLHPTWQCQVGSWFREHFPAMQFVVATHSPLICQSADTVFLLARPGTDERGRMLGGAELDRVRFGNVLDAYGTGVFGQGVERSQYSKQLLQRLATLNAKELAEDLTPDERVEQEHLRSILPTGTGATSGAGTEPPV
jgi:nucleoside phosphorylase/energy-coupling factor transporter ATP-binding protein EcfA2